MKQWREQNKEKVKKNNRASYKRRNERDPEREYQRRRDSAIYSKYGLRPHEYEELLEKFNNSCAICGSTKQLCIDHDHYTNEIRGILCKTCNTAIGLLGDSFEGLKVALEYLKRG
jgi:hypothetical protein